MIATHTGLWQSDWLRVTCHASHHGGAGCFALSSGIAFSAAKPGLDFEWCSAPETGLPAPDVVIFLQIDAESASSRGGFGQERYEHNAFQKIVRSMVLRVTPCALALATSQVTPRSVRTCVVV